MLCYECVSWQEQRESSDNNDYIFENECKQQ